MSLNANRLEWDFSKKPRDPLYGKHRWTRKPKLPVPFLVTEALVETLEPEIDYDEFDDGSEYEYVADDSFFDTRPLSDWWDDGRDDEFDGGFWEREFQEEDDSPFNDPIYREVERLAARQPHQWY